MRIKSSQQVASPNILQKIVAHASYEAIETHRAYFPIDWINIDSQQTQARAAIIAPGPLNLVHQGVEKTFSIAQGGHIVNETFAGQSTCEPIDALT